MKRSLAVAVLIIAGYSAVLGQDVARTYAANCAHCHGAQGAGDTPLGRTLKLRDLKSAEVKKLTLEQLSTIIGHGAAQGKMPAFEKKLGSQTILQLAAYVKSIDAQLAMSQLEVKAKTKPEPLDARDVYAAKCSHCHGADGSGETVLGRRLKIQDMRFGKLEGYSDSQLVAIIGSGADWGRMPGFQKRLGTDMVEQLAGFVRTLCGSPLTHQPTTAKNYNQQPRTGEQPTETSQPHVENRPIETGAAKQVINAPVAHLPRATTAQLSHAAKLPVIDLNTATKEILMSLPGITEPDATNIIAARPFKSTLQFKTRKVISDRTYAQIADRIMVKASASRLPVAAQQESKGMQ